MNVDVTKILQAHVDAQGGNSLHIPASNVKLFQHNDPKHHRDCTWICYEAAGEVAPGQSLWGQINYQWCQKFCHGVESPTPAAPPSRLRRLLDWVRRATR